MLLAEATRLKRYVEQLEEARKKDEEETLALKNKMTKMHDDIR